MKAEIAVMNILSNDSTYAAIVGSGSNAKIYFDEAEQTQTLPFAIIKADSMESHDTNTTRSTLDEDFIYVTHFSSTKKQVLDMAVAARTALEKVTGTYNSVIVLGIQFRNRQSDTERLVDKKVFTEEQLYKIITKQ
jgi:hypothetical protein